MHVQPVRNARENALLTRAARYGGQDDLGIAWPGNDRARSAPFASVDVHLGAALFRLAHIAHLERSDLHPAQPGALKELNQGLPVRRLESGVSLGWPARAGDALAFPAWQVYLGGQRAIAKEEAQ